METTKKRIPNHLQKYVIDQQYDRYTSIDQAVWRYVMRQNKHFLNNTAHPAYSDGLAASGISIEKIPNVEEMNESLSPFEWGAVNIDGFIPGVIFFDFQAHGLLPIASDIRKLENIQYTPAPDIIHEAAGHAPILCDDKFSEYVKLFGHIGSKAIATKEEHDVFEATRHYSNLLESGTATEAEINLAKKDMEEKQKKVTILSEAEQISRLYWWTVEYGLIGTVNDPKIYGAGLLSSVAEGKNSITDAVEKIPFDLQQVIQTGFDITKPQPQLFVCERFEQLIEAVEQFSETMAWKRGGTESLEKAINSAHTATIEYSSGLQVTGTLSKIIKDTNGEAIYMNTVGETTLNSGNKEINGHGKETHADGFGSPIGLLKDTEKPLEEWTNQELVEAGIVIGVPSELSFESGVVVTGVPTEVIRNAGKIQVISFKDCAVTFNGETLFDPSWGSYDMAVGEKIVSVFAGAADSEAFYDHIEQAVNVEIEQQNPTRLEELYGNVRVLRESTNNLVDLESSLPMIIDELTTEAPIDWLLRIEILELLLKNDILPDKQGELLSQLEQLKSINHETNELIDRGLKIINE
ncbi:aromatic amino acid hydroxylase [Bacillus spongiae]|uniref:Aromatic amino acid hydroxylase n=1 Tax=Bacillus spongiae TaxID=2683610 RepID=A0ABU8HBV7_9BACI